MFPKFYPVGAAAKVLVNHQVQPADLNAKGIGRGCAQPPKPKPKQVELNGDIEKTDILRLNGIVMRLADVYYIYIYTLYIYIYVAKGKLKQAARTVQARQENPIDFPCKSFNPLESH